MTDKVVSFQRHGAAKDSSADTQSDATVSVVDVTTTAKAVGFDCSVYISQSLWERLGMLGHPGQLNDNQQSRIRRFLEEGAQAAARSESADTTFSFTSAQEVISVRLKLQVADNAVRIIFH